MADYLSERSLTALQDKVNAATDRQVQNQVSGKDKVGKLATIHAIVANITVQTQMRAAQAASINLQQQQRQLPSSHQSAQPDHDQLNKRALQMRRDVSSTEQTLHQMLESAVPENHPQNMTSSETLETISKLTVLGDEMEAKVMAVTEGWIDNAIGWRKLVQDLRDNVSVYVSNLP